MKAVEVTGLEALRARLARAAAPEPFKKALREEAEALAGELRREAPAELAAGIEVKDVSQGDRLGFSVGTADPAGRALKFGTLKRPASPWLWPIFRARLPALKDKLRKLADQASNRRLPWFDRGLVMGSGAGRAWCRTPYSWLTVAYLEILPWQRLQVGPFSAVSIRHSPALPL